MLEVATGLMRLVLRRCYMRRCKDSLSALSTLTDLQHLVLDRLVRPHASLAHADRTDSNTWAPIPGCLFSQLLKLTHLELSSGVGGLTQETFQHISCLTDLQHLGLTALKWEPNGPRDPTVYSLVGLSRLTQLTCLDLDDCWGELTVEGPPRLSLLTNLRHLCLWDIESLEPAALAGMTQLQHLQLHAHLAYDGTPGVAALLASLQQLQQLTMLQIQAAFEKDEYHVDPAPAAAHMAAAPAAAAPAAAAAACLAPVSDDAAAPTAAAAARPFAALTASSELRELCLTAVDTELPPGVWQHVFAPDKHLPHLTTFEATSCSYYGSFDRPIMTDADLASLAHCCPNLAHLRAAKWLWRLTPALRPCCS